MSVESWAQKVVEAELRLPVVVHDDNTQPLMYDLRIGLPDAPAVAIECVGAVDSTRIETWNIGPARGPLTLAVRRDWIVSIRPTARIKDLALRLEAILQECENRGLLPAGRVDWRLKRANPKLFSDLEGLGITFISCFRARGKGKVALTMDGVGGAVDSEGLAIPQWIGDFLTAPERADVLSKLARSSAPHCHAFVIVDFAGAPWPVQSYLEDDLTVLPPTAPSVPAPVTAVWVLSTSNTTGVRWTGTNWKRFRAERYAASP